MIEYAEIPVCRRRESVLGYFGESVALRTIAAAATFAWPPTAEEIDATEVTQKVLSAVIRTGERFGAMHVIKVLQGQPGEAHPGIGPRPAFSVLWNCSRTCVDADTPGRSIAHLRARGLLERKESENLPSLCRNSEAGRPEFLRRAGRRPSPCQALKANESSATQVRGSGRVMAEGAPSEALGEYDATLFEELRGLRRELADEQNVPPFVVFGDVSLRHMAAAFPQSLDTFARVPGVGKAKLEQYGRRFVGAISAFAQAHGIPDRSEGLVTQASPRISRNGEGNDGRRASSRGSTYEQTRELLSQGLTVQQIAQARNLAEATIIGQLERMSSQGEELVLDHLLPDPDRFDRIREAFDVCGADFLKPAWEYLASEISYDELRIARMFLRQEALLEGESSRTSG